MSHYIEVTKILDRGLVIARLSRLVEEWTEAVGGQSLLAMEGNVGLILGDIAKNIGLTPDEQAEALGPLYQEIQAMAEQPVSVSQEELNLLPAD